MPTHQDEPVTDVADDPADASPDKLVPVAEAIRYRKRAQTAEQQLDDAQQRLKALQTQLEQSRQAVDTLERRRQIDALLTASDAIDLDAARLLTEAALVAMDEPDAARAVDELKRRKPYLFHARAAAPAAMAAPLPDAADGPADRAAEQAAATGNRRDLLRYLRLRRTE